MITLNDYFSKCYWIGSVNRPDRAALMEEQLRRYNITAERFEAHWKPVNYALDPVDRPSPSGNYGCTSSHRGVLELICHFKWPRTFVMEDDNVFVDGWQEQFDEMIREVPDTFDFLFLGASYAEDAKRRINGSVIQTNGLMTTSSYGITHAMARRMAPFIFGEAGVDSLFQGWQQRFICLILNPRLCVQRAGYSDIQDRVCDHSQSMLDRAHEDRI